MGKHSTSALLTDIHSTLLTHTDLSIQWVEMDQEHLPIDQIWIELAATNGSDEELHLQIFCANEALAPEARQQESSIILFFFAMLPIALEPTRIPYAARLLALINQLLPVGAFELNEAEGIYFRYGLMLDESWSDGMVTLDVTQALSYTLPRLSQWISDVLSEGREVWHDLDALKEEFRELLHLSPPVRQALPRSLRGADAPRLPHPWNLSYFLIAMLSSIAGPLTMALSHWLAGALVSLLILVPGFWVTYHYQRRRERLQRMAHQRNQLLFYTRLLHIENIKLAHQRTAMHTHRSQLEDKLDVLAHREIATPGDLVRRHHLLKILKQHEEHLDQRSHQLKQRQHELDRSNDQLTRERNSFLEEAHRIEPSLASAQTFEMAAQPLNTETELFNHLRQALDFLDFRTQRLPANEHEPLQQLIISPTENNSQFYIQLSYASQWFECEDPAFQPKHTWMLYFQSPLVSEIPPERLPDVAHFLVMCNRLMPIGQLALNIPERSVVLKYAFARLQGDLGSFLMIEILEVLAYFALQLRPRLEEFLAGDVTVSEVMDSMQREFQRLQSS